MTKADDIDYRPTDRSTSPRDSILNPRHVSIIIMSIFILGASGYIGGSVLVGLKRTFATHEYVALVRDEKKIPAIEGMSASGVRSDNPKY